MSQILAILSAIALSISITGCSLAPIAKELPLAAGSPMAPSTEANLGKVVFLNENPKIYRNDSDLRNVHGLDRDLWKMAGTGRINIAVNGKGLGQVHVGEFLATLLPFGTYEITLVHQDMVNFESKHQLVVNTPHKLVAVFPTITSNTLEVVPASRGLGEYKEAK
ncbi:hypothetical protein C1O66_02170 [Paucibacter aquatile]|uniref:DUF2846 domain-containing protein n=1 Tax=Kinneretia aquatilis TaxID=2070761 RepID=A0A2N8L3D1_9BURK|nr:MULTISPECIES: hypothetical protein [Roseateles]PND40210.1 hypothetical protein C1O66_02170 [Paucibacter aquatile]WIV99063.1 hypothetical protein K9V56_006135 [Paucibacter aquatile]